MNLPPRLVIEAANATTDQELAGRPPVGPSLARGRREGPSVNADKDTRPESADAAWMRARSDDSVPAAESRAARSGSGTPGKGRRFHGAGLERLSDAVGLERPGGRSR